jgi:ubiquinone/menaquinone biosynthesis C-methylase UbiE
MMLQHGRACGIDISPQMIAHAKNKSESDRVEFLCAGAECIPYPDSSFDYVMCSNSFHHYPDPLHSLNEMYRVLVPKGRLAIFENAVELSWYTWLWDKWLRLFEKGHVKYYTSLELGELIRRSDFQVGTLRILRSEKRKHGKLFASIQVWTADKG